MRLAFLKSRLVRAGLNSAVLRFISTVLTIAVSIFLARLIGPDGMGYYAFAMSIVALAGIPTQMGIPVLVLRETAKSEQRQDWPQMRGVWNWASRRVLIATTVLIPSIALVSWFFKGPVLSPLGLKTIWAALPMLFFFAVGQLRASALRGMSRPALGLIPDGIFRPLIQLISLGVIALLVQEPQSYLAALVNVGASFLAFILGSFFLYSTAPKELWKFTPDQSSAAEWRKAVLPLALVSGMLIVIQNLNIMVLGVFHTPEETGFFRIALSASSMIVFGMTVVNFVVTPSFAKLHANMSSEEMARTAQISAALSFATALPIALLFVFGGGSLLVLLYGEAFRDAYLPLVVLAGSKLILTAYGSCGNLLNMTGNERDDVRALVLGLAANLCASLVLVPILGGLGAAIATLAGTLVWNIHLAQKVTERLGFSGSAFPILLSKLCRN